MESSELFGFAAAFFTTGAFLPQVLRSYLTKSSKDISWAYLAMFFIGICLWLAYGWLISSAPVIAANSITAALVLALVMMKWKYG